MIDVTIHTDVIPLDAFLKWAGVADTGGLAKRMIADGTVSVNGAVCCQRGRKLRAGDRVTVGEETFAVRGGGNPT